MIKVDFFKKYEKEHFDKQSTKLFLARLVAFIMGDGHIRKNKEGVSFFFKEKSDSEAFKRDFNNHFDKEKVVIIDKGSYYICNISSRSLSDMLHQLGAPVGNKVFQPFYIPTWILHGPNYIKLGFLSVIYGNEGSKPKNNRWRIQLVLSKNKGNVENLLIFLNQVRAMLQYFGISTTFIQLRKQKRRQFCGRFYIKSKENLHKFYKLLGFSYAQEKQRILESLILKGDSFEV